MQDELPWGESPVDIAGDEPHGASPAAPPNGLGWTIKVLIVSSLLLLAFNSHAIANWANQLPITASSAPIVNAAQHWHDVAGTMGLNRVVDTVERGAEALRKARWRDAPDNRSAP